ncbi:CoA-binding protein [Actinopolymorpha sp. B11F2]|uniref:CoA-binding protein n=1 Tax=Actinopolymorpha sp. B11F2 TaxID=3160862 RepID=UPI0032E3C79D
MPVRCEEILREARTVVLHDWPSRDVPDTLTRAGYEVVVFGGPKPDDVFASELRDGEIVETRIGVPPDRGDLVYVFRPIEELPAIVADAQRMGATAVWCQSGLSSEGVTDPRGCWTSEAESQEARRIVESAGLTYVADAYIADAVRTLQGQV